MLQPKIDVAMCSEAVFRKLMVVSGFEASPVVRYTIESRKQELSDSTKVQNWIFSCPNKGFEVLGVPYVFMCTTSRSTKVWYSVGCKVCVTVDSHVLVLSSRLYWPSALGRINIL
jgi:hypothetical protein